MIFEASTDTLYKKGLKLLAGAMGRYYQVAEVSFDFLPKDRDIWISYDYDGKGTKRLRRDITSIVDEWKEELFDFERSPLIDLEDEEEMEEILAGSYFKKLWDEGRMKEIIKSQIFRDPQMTYQYGTYSERINPGIDLILEGLEREKAEIKDSFLAKKEKEEKLARIEEFKSQIEQIKKDTLERVKEEYGALRKSPQEFKKYLSDPESISELRGFETVWSAIQWTMLTQYTTDKLTKTLQGELGEEKKQELLGMLRERIEENPYFSSIMEIRDVEARVLFMDYRGFWSLYSKITEEII